MILYSCVLITNKINVISAICLCISEITSVNFAVIYIFQLRQWHELQREKLLIEQRFEAERACAAAEKLELEMEAIAKRRQEDKRKACVFVSQLKPFNYLNFLIRFLIRSSAHRAKET